jgi:hypothetical protein
VKITQSILGQADKCLLSAQYTLDRPVWVRRKASAAATLGTGFHAGLEHYYAERMRYPDLQADDPQMVVDMIETAHLAFDAGTRIDAYNGQPVEHFMWDDKIPDLATAHSLLETMLTAYCEQGWWWPVEFQVVGVEFDRVLTIVHGDVEFEAKLGADLVLQDENGWIVLVDHKTAGRAWDESKHHPRRNNQASMYTALAETVWPDAAGHRFVFDIVTLPGKRKETAFERRISDPTPAHRAAVVKKAADLARLYQVVHVEAGQDLPANPASTLCNPKWCDFWDGCPHGAVLD